MFTFSKPAVQGMHRSNQTEHNPHSQEKNCTSAQYIFNRNTWDTCNKHAMITYITIDHTMSNCTHLCAGKIILISCLDLDL